MITRTLFFFRCIFTRRRDTKIYNAYDLISRKSFYDQAQTEIPVWKDGIMRKQNVPARPLGPSWDQWKAVWLVLTGRADVLH